MSNTERLYYADSHLIEFDARVVRLTETEDGRRAVLLDRTAFYPTGGGQPTDTGMIDTARVVECVDLEDKGVLHVFEGELPAEGSLVKGLLDWPRRLDHIQQHTGQHILSQAFARLYGAPTRSFRMMSESSEIDLELPHLSAERIEGAVDLANRIIWEDRALRIHQVTPEEAAGLPLRKDSAREGELRVIEIEGFDFSPCGGTHAQRAGEVGLIAVRSWERAKSMTRVEFVAGGRALDDYRRANRTSRAVAAHFSAGRDETPALVERLLEENKNLARRARTLEQLAARVEAEEALAGAREIGPLRLVTRVLDGRDAESLKRFALAVVAHPRTVALLGSPDDGTARLVFARSADASGDMNALMRAASAHLGGRGGGRPDMAQGGGPQVEKLEEVLATAARSYEVTT
ncbi:MAG: alanyl-tRNA editing protein [Pyrinomonadaceae bacterium]